MKEQEKRTTKKEQDDDKKAEIILDILPQTRLSVFGQATFITLLIMLIFGGGGYFIDKKIGTFPGLFITGIVIAFPVTQFYLYRKIKKFAQDKVNKSLKK